MSCKGLKGKALKDCMAAAAVKRKNKKDSLVVERTRQRDSVTKALQERNLAKKKKMMAAAVARKKNRFADSERRHQMKIDSGWQHLGRYNEYHGGSKRKKQ